MDKDIRKFDFTLFFTVIALAILGIILIGSALHIDEVYQDGIPPLFRNQIIWVVLGVFIMLLAAFFSLEFITRFYIPIYLLNIFLLVAVIVLKKVTGKSVLREIRIGPIGIMPSEFSKIFMIIFLSTLIYKFKDRINEFKILLLICILALIPFLLTVLQPSLSASIVLIVILVSLLFVGGVSYKYIAIALAIIIPTAGFLYYDFNSEEHIIVDEIFTEYQLGRIQPYFNPEEEEEFEQTENSIYAIGSGGPTGQGLFNNPYFVPESQNDFIFAVLGAEFGFLGTLMVLLVMLFIVTKCLIIAMKSDILLGRLIASGVGTVFAFQVFVNVGVATGLLPNTGMAFPFLSAGGSAMWINMALIGLVLNVGMTGKQELFDE